MAQAVKNRILNMDFDSIKQNKNADWMKEEKKECKRDRKFKKKKITKEWNQQIINICKIDSSPFF